MPHIYVCKKIYIISFLKNRIVLILEYITDCETTHYARRFNIPAHSLSLFENVQKGKSHDTFHLSNEY